MKYTVEDIDRMRRAVWQLTVVWGEPYHGDDLERQVERALRTYMDNGTTLAELEEAVQRRNQS